MLSSPKVNQIPKQPNILLPFFWHPFWQSTKAEKRKWIPLAFYNNLFLGDKKKKEKKTLKLFSKETGFWYYPNDFMCTYMDTKLKKDNGWNAYGHENSKKDNGWNAGLENKMCPKLDENLFIFDTHKRLEEVSVCLFKEDFNYA